MAKGPIHRNKLTATNVLRLPYSRKPNQMNKGKGLSLSLLKYDLKSTALMSCSFRGFTRWIYSLGTKIKNLISNF